MNRAAMYIFDHVPYPAEWEEMSDESLLGHYQSTSDQLIICYLLKRHKAPIIAISFSYLKNAEAIEDFVQDLYERLVIKLPEAEIRNFKSFLITVVKNKHKDDLGKYEVRQAYQQAERIRRDPFSDNDWDFELDNPFSAEKLKELSQQGRLSPMEGLCLEMRAQGLKAGDIAKLIEPKVLGLWPKEGEQDCPEFLQLKKKKVFGALERAYKKMKALLAKDYQQYFQM